MPSQAEVPATARRHVVNFFGLSAYLFPSQK
jgi:hypothetical protein